MDQVSCLKDHDYPSGDTWTELGYPESPPLSPSVFFAKGTCPLTAVTCNGEMLAFPGEGAAPGVCVAILTLT